MKQDPHLEIESILRGVGVSLKEKRRIMELVHEIEARASAHDVTGLPRRRGAREHMRKALCKKYDSGKGFGMLYCDLDKFKPVNDTYGHAAGDKILEIVGNRLSAQIRSTDMVAHIGGDEFWIILANVDERDIEQKKLDIKEAISTPIAVYDHKGMSRTVSVGISIGSSVFTKNGDVETVCQSAEIEADARLKDEKIQKGTIGR